MFCVTKICEFNHGKTIQMFGNLKKKQGKNVYVPISTIFYVIGLKR